MRSPVYRNSEEELLQKVFDYLVQNGLENISMRELCKSTEISMGSVYYWFKNKEQMILEAAEYGLSVMSDGLFGFVFAHLDSLDVFFATFLDELEKYKAQLRLLSQMATSPLYGRSMREASTLLTPFYDRYIEEFANKIGSEKEKVAPLIYLFISMMVDYAIWEDRVVSQMQCDYIYAQIQKLQTEVQTAKNVM